jgi:hypothetical protein
MRKSEEELVNKGIRFPVSLLKEIERLAALDDRTFSQQVIHYCKIGVKALKEHETEAHQSGGGTIRRVKRA